MAWSEHVDKFLVALFIQAQYLSLTTARTEQQFQINSKLEFCTPLLHNAGAYNMDVSHGQEALDCQCYLRTREEGVALEVSRSEISGGQFVQVATFPAEDFTAEVPSYANMTEFTRAISLDVRGDGITFGGQKFTYGQGGIGSLLRIQTDPLGYFEVLCTNNNFGRMPTTTTTTTTTTVSMTTTTTNIDSDKSSSSTSSSYVTVTVTKPGPAGGSAGKSNENKNSNTGSSSTPIIVGVCIGLVVVVVLIVVIVIFLKKRRAGSSNSATRATPAASGKDQIYKPVSKTEP